MGGCVHACAGILSSSHIWLQPQYLVLWGQNDIAGRGGSQILFNSQACCLNLMSHKWGTGRGNRKATFTPHLWVAYFPAARDSDPGWAYLLAGTKEQILYELWSQNSSANSSLSLPGLLGHCPVCDKAKWGFLNLRPRDWGGFHVGKVENCFFPQLIFIEPWIQSSALWSFREFVF